MVLLNIELKFGGLLSRKKEILIIVGGLLLFNSDRLQEIEIASLPKEDIGCVHNITKLWYIDKSCRWVGDGLEKLKHRKKW